MDMFPFVIRRIHKEECGTASSQVAADEGAQVVADKMNETVGVYELAREFSPQPSQPQPATCPIDELIQEAARRYLEYGDNAAAFRYGTLMRYKKAGATEWIMPPGFKGL